MASSAEREYVLGTHDEEIERLGLQHRVWRPRVLDAWQRAGFAAGQRLVDVGCGPGWAALDLAEIVGPGGRVVAVDRSRRFLDALEARREARGLRQIETHEADLDVDPLPALEADGAWSRWVLAFVARPRPLVERVAAALRPGARWVVHEYFHYATWRFAPPLPVFDEFVRVVMASWRESGGEPDIGLELPEWLEAAGFTVLAVRPLLEVIGPRDPWWAWPRAFVDVGLRRLVDLGRLTAERAAEVQRAFAEREARAGTRMVTPAVLEIVAERR